MLSGHGAPSDVADLFCVLYDALDGLTFRRSVERWSSAPALLSLSADVEQGALAGTLEPGALSRRADADDRRYAVLRGLDAALSAVNPAMSGVPPPALAGLAGRYASEGRLDTGAAEGALLPRFASAGRRGQLPDDLADAFAAVVRVPKPDWDACDHAMLPAWARLTRSDRESGLRIAATPFIADPDEMEWEVREREDLRFYRLGPADRAATRSRARRVVGHFDDQRAVIGVAPELCLSPALLEEWRTALAERPGATSSPLRLVLAGTGNVDGVQPPSNTAILLDAQTGEVLVRQRKIHPFNFTAPDVELWGLAERFSAPIDEDLDPGARITVIEAGGARLAILVCEDLARLPRLAGPLCTHGISLILVPVFARPTKDRRWERTRAESYSEATGATIVVANSLVMAHILGTELPAGTAIAVAPGTAALGRSTSPEDTVLFVLNGGSPVIESNGTIAPCPTASTSPRTTRPTR